jgi:putative DNA methylase
MTEDKRLIEDYLPIEKISAEASREKSVRKGHISTLHLWWARRPLVACRAAVYAALVPASRFVPNGASDEKKKSLGRANAAKFVERLCRYPSESKPEIASDIERAVIEAQRHVLEAHAQRLTQETGQNVTVEDIVQGRAPRPKVLDMFAGGGAIPLEALRLGCESYALDLNPVAHIIELCTLVYPQKYGKSDRTARGMTGPKDANGETTWGGLAQEVRYWGTWILKQLKGQIGDLYPVIPDPEFKRQKTAVQTDWFKDGTPTEVPQGFLMPVAYLWTRTVTCKNPNCRATVPLVKQTWLCKKKDRFVALKMVAPKGKKEVRFDVVEDDGVPLPSDKEWLKELKSKEKNLKESDVRDLLVTRHFGFDPEAGSKRGNAICPFCDAVADSDYVKAEGKLGKIMNQFLAIAATKQGVTGKRYLGSADLEERFLPGQEKIRLRLDELLKANAMPPLDETIEINPRSMDIDRAGFTKWEQVFLPRQQLALFSICAAVRKAETEMASHGIAPDQQKAVVTLLGCGASKFADFCSALCTFNYTGGRGVKNSFPQQSLPMVWDFAETNPFNPAGASWIAVIEDNPAVIEGLEGITQVGVVQRGSALALPWETGSMDAVVTDPPYYDNVSYSNLSDFFMLWMRRSIGHLYPEHFAFASSPKKQEIIAAPYRHGGHRDRSRDFYEQMMKNAFVEAFRVLKPSGELVVVYAHKTTLGWSTLLDALRRAGFMVNEAWPLDTERKGRVIAMDTAALASSIFLACRKRDLIVTGNYEEQVRPELEQIVRERVGTLWEMGISGADLVIACIGAGLRPFTRFAKVEYANGEEVPAARFLMEVETVVLESILTRLSKEVGGNGGKHSLAGLDPSTRFYVLWRYTYKIADLDAGEAIIFANGTHVELDGAHGLSSGTLALAAKNKSKYRLLDYTARGDDAALGMPSGDGQPAPLIDALHRLLWLMERRPSGIPDFLREARPNTDQIRLVAQALAGPVLKGGELGEVATGTELAALTKLTANWRSVVEDVDLTRVELEARRTGQSRMQFDRGGRP